MPDNSLSSLPIVPLHAVLFPQGPLPLRIFEPRYLDMVSQCMKNNSPFGICLISDGEEVGSAAHAHEVGTVANILDWHMGNDGILGISVLGETRFRVQSSKVLDNQLIMANVELLDSEPYVSLPPKYQHLVPLLKDLMKGFADRYDRVERNFDDASWVGCRLAELLPLKLSQRQYFLQLTDPIQRLERVVEVLDHIDLAS